MPARPALSYTCPGCGALASPARIVLCADCGDRTCPDCREQVGHHLLCEVCAEARAIRADDDACPLRPPRHSRLYPGD